MKYDTVIGLLEKHRQDEAVALVTNLRLEEAAARSKRPPRKVVSRKITAELRDEIKEYFHETDEPQHVIAITFGVNQGRVNEILNGEWDDLT